MTHPETHPQAAAIPSIATIKNAIVWLIGNTKGGVGKTTNAVELAVSLADDGGEVLLINGDRQNHADESISNRDAAGITPSIATANYPEGKILAQQVKIARSKYDHIVIDSGGRDSSSLRSALNCCDIAFVPFSPGSYECWSLDDIASLVELARETREIPLPVYTFLNAAYPNPEEGPMNKDNQDAVNEAMKHNAVMEFLSPQLVRRKAFSTAAGMGIAITALRPRNPKAESEYADLLAVMKECAQKALAVKAETLAAAEAN